jgi:hypothetical protein
LYIAVQSNWFKANKILIMETLAIEIINNKAFALLDEMQNNNLIKVKKESLPTKKKSFAGAMQLTNKEYKDFVQHTKTVRNEWQ